MSCSISAALLSGVSLRPLHAARTSARTRTADLLRRMRLDRRRGWRRQLVDIRALREFAAQPLERGLRFGRLLLPLVGEPEMVERLVAMAVFGIRGEQAVEALRGRQRQPEAQIEIADDEFVLGEVVLDLAQLLLGLGGVLAGRIQAQQDRRKPRAPAPPPSGRGPASPSAAPGSWRPGTGRRARGRWSGSDSGSRGTWPRPGSGSGCRPAGRASRRPAAAPRGPAAELGSASKAWVRYLRASPYSLRSRSTLPWASDSAAERRRMGSSRTPPQATAARAATSASARNRERLIPFPGGPSGAAPASPRPGRRRRKPPSRRHRRRRRRPRPGGYYRARRRHRLRS